MKIIIAGGSGLIGLSLAANLAETNYDVIILSRSPEKMRHLPSGVVAHKWDGQTAEGWGHLADGAKAIINLAGEGIADGRWTAERKVRIRNSRVYPGQAIVQAIEAASTKPEVVIQASAVGYYGPQNDAKITEETPSGNDFLAEICRAWEDSVAPITNMGVRLVRIRTGVVLSLDGGALPKMALPFKLFAGGPIGSGKQWLPWVHLNDTVAAIQYLMETKAASGPYNLTAPNPLTNAQFGHVLGKVLGRPAFMPTPALAMKLIFGEMSTVLLDGQRAVPEKLQALDYKFQYPDAESALRDLYK